MKYSLEMPNFAKASLAPGQFSRASFGMSSISHKGLHPFLESRDVAGVYRYNGGKDDLFKKIQQMESAYPGQALDEALHVLQQARGHF